MRRSIYLAAGALAIAVMAATGGAAVAAADDLSASADLAAVTVDPVRLSFAPPGAFESAVVTLNSDTGFRGRYDFVAGDTIAVDLFGADGEVLADGGYRYLLEMTGSAKGRGLQYGMFYIQDGVAISREAKRGEIGDIRRELMGEAPQAVPTEGTTSHSDYVTIVDTDQDDSTGLRIDNYNVTFDTRLTQSGGDAFLYSGYILDLDGFYQLNLEAGSDGMFGDSSGGLYLTAATSAWMTAGNYSSNQYGATTWDRGNSGGNWLTSTASTGTFISAIPSPPPASEGIYTTGTLTVRPFGTGINTTVPSASLHVTSAYGNYGNARLMVSEAHPTATGRELFRLQNNGVPQFRFEDTNSGVTWAFAQQVGGFVANRIGTGGNEMFIQGSGRVQFGPGPNVVFDLAPNGNLTIDGTLTQGSSREAKRDFLPLDSAEILDKVAELPLSSWRYKQDKTRHVGPMAEDFYEAFDVGEDDKHLAPGDAAGVALAAIQGLNDRLSAENEALREALAAVLERLDRLEQRE